MADFNWPVAPDPEPPPVGKCIIGYLRAQCVERFARLIMEILFKIVEPTDHAGKIVRKYYSIPMNEPPGLESNYYRDWTRANGAPPSRNDRMTPTVFKGYWRAELGQTTQRAVRDKGKGWGPATPGWRSRTDYRRELDRTCRRGPRATSRYPLAAELN